MNKIDKKKLKNKKKMSYNKNKLFKWLIMANNKFERVMKTRM